MDEFRTFDFHRIFFGDLPYLFLLEIVFRTAVMYAYTILLLRFLGKRSMGQLSTLELAIIICFGSAVGDPMMGRDIPVLHGMVVITTVAILQSVAEWAINRNKKLESLMEGNADCLVQDGKIIRASLDKNSLSTQDLFRFLRDKQVEHLGQVRNAFFETSGLVSVWCFPKNENRPGLSILPEEHLKNHVTFGMDQTVESTGHYSCSLCGETKRMASQSKFGNCMNCLGSSWERSKLT